LWFELSVTQLEEDGQKYFLGFMEEHTSLLAATQTPSSCMIFSLLQLLQASWQSGLHPVDLPFTHLLSLGQ
jgi:hypothetical protein